VEEMARQGENGALLLRRQEASRAEAGIFHEASAGSQDPARSIRTIIPPFRKILLIWITHL
jgi:hypothetical protein